MRKRTEPGRTKKIVCLFLAINLLFQAISPTVSMALTSGPSQEEFASFEPSTTTDMVDLYSGDFNYNIPLLSVPGPNGGYPINLAYHAGIGMEQEASWVGLGWSLNVGAINRQLRGLPDDFSSELIKKRQHMKESWMVALDLPIRKHTEYFGSPSPGGLFGQHVQVYYNNYRGMGYRYSVSFPNKGADEMAPVGLNIGFDSQNGLDVEPRLSVSRAFGRTGWGSGFNLGLSYNSRQGLQSFAFTGKGISTNSRFLNSLGPSSLSFSSRFSVPETKMKTKSTLVPFNLKVAKPSSMGIPGLFSASFPLLWSGYVSRTKMVDNGRVEYPAYGYLNDLEHNGDDVLRDFSRDNIQYSKKIPNLPMSNFTYDIFSQTGQGTGSNFRAYHNQIHVLRDPEVISEESSHDIEFEFGLGPGNTVAFPGNVANLHIGGGYNYGSGESRSGAWSQIKNVPDEHAVLSALKGAPQYGAGDEDKKLAHERSYFKAYGEKTGYYAQGAEDQLHAYGGEAALRLDIEKEKSDRNFLNRHYKVTDKLVSEEGGGAVTANLGNKPVIQELSRAKRASNIEYFTNSEAAQFGYSRGQTYYNSANAAVAKFPNGHNPHHLSEISVLQPNGMRYVYGIATYNSKQVDNVFTSKSGGNFNTNTVSIQGGFTEGIDISGTKEEYMERTELPEYANGWLLTSIFSSDYLDLTNDGPTDDDYGFWIKFNYQKAHDNYRWRVPYNGAAFIEGNKNDATDDKASYAYGEKDIYYVYSVESKTHLARFITSSRCDAVEAATELNNGGSGTRTLKKLDKIVLYSKKDLAANGSAAKPVKSVHFVYSYELCPGVPNNNGNSDVTNDHYDDQGNFIPGTTNINTGLGKLTLTQVYFTYQNSKRSLLSPYIFKYGSGPQLNPSYNRTNMDRWGNFKNNSGHYGGSGNTYPYIDNPYTPQDAEFYNPANTHYLAPGQWCLNQIFLPTGGVMNIDYEFDDYYYEENLKAQRMYDITGMGSSQNGIRGTGPTTGNPENHTLYFKLEEPVANVTEFYEKYLAGLNKRQVYYKVFADIKGAFASTYDYVSGYGELDTSPGSYGIAGNGTIGYVQLKKVPLGKTSAGPQVSPISRAILEHLKVNRPELIHSVSASGNGGVKAQVLNLLSSTLGIMGDVVQAVTGFNRWAYIKFYNSGGNFQVRLNGYSVMRLCDPDEKIGGGLRVKKLSLTDNWKNGVNNDASTYGQSYDYTTTDASGNLTSSGVAYEPHIGSEESALRTAVKFSSSSLFKSDYNLFVETPIARSHYPGEQVGYSKVTVRSLGAEENYNANNKINLPQSNAAPIGVYEFYTPRDFPVIVHETDNGPYSKPVFIPIPVLGLFTTVKRRYAKSQGYTVVLNDMAGKPKSTGMYTAKLSAGPNGELLSKPDKVISYQRFIYQTKKTYNPNAVNELDNQVQTVGVNGAYQTVYQTACLGQTHDLYIDMDENSQYHEGFGLTGNLDMSFWAVGLPIPIGWILPSYHKTTNNMRTVVMNKIIHKAGILSKVESTQGKSTVITENLAFDIENGEPLLTRTSNEFNDPVYAFNYQGHWYYKNMGAAYKNSGVRLHASSFGAITSNNAGVISLPVANAGNNYFTKGDLVYINTGSSAHDGLYHVFSLSGNQLKCIRPSGNYFAPNQNIQSIHLVKSGYKNQQAVAVGSLTFKNLPGFSAVNPQVQSTIKTSPTGLTVDNVSNQVLNASATDFSDDWQMQGGNQYLKVEPAVQGCTANINVSGALFTFLNGLNSSNQLFASNVLVAQNNNGYLQPFLTSNLSFSNGFNSTLLAAFKGLSQMSNYPFGNGALPPLISNGKSLYYSGYVSPVSKNFVIVLSNFLIPSTVTDPGTICNGASFNMGNSNSYLPMPGIQFALPPGMFNLVGNGTTYWSGFVQNSPTYLNAMPAQGVCAPVADGALYSANVPGYGVQNVESHCNYCYATVPPPGGATCETCFTYTSICTAVQMSVTNISCGTQTGTVINPYQNGMKGIWRPKRSYAFDTLRTQTNNIRTDGSYAYFVKFPWQNPASRDAHWREVNTITKYNQAGFEVENRNAIGNFAAALYGHGQALNVAVASNARYTDIGYDGFEDYPKSCDEDHLGFAGHSALITNSRAHSGQFSIRLPGPASVKAYRQVLTNCDLNTGGSTPYVNDQFSNIVVMSGTNVAHSTKACDFVGKFNPQAGKKYVVSAWLSTEYNISGNPLSPPATYTNGAIQVNLVGLSPITGYTFFPEGNIIDGWQRIYGEFEIPPGTASVELELTPWPMTGVPVDIPYFDDVRIHPLDATMKTFVYDPITWKPLAELDDNNYATFYNYDDEGNLIKIKRETERGISTIKEGRSNTKKVSN